MHHDHIPGPRPIPPDPIVPTPRITSAIICRGLDIENDFLIFGEVDKVGEVEGENEGVGDDGVGDVMSAETERLERHGKRLRVGE